MDAAHFALCLAYSRRPITVTAISNAGTKYRMALNLSKPRMRLSQMSPKISSNSRALWSLPPVFLNPNETMNSRVKEMGWEPLSLPFPFLAQAAGPTLGSTHLLQDVLDRRQSVHSQACC